jgi:small neutral amino acid transporter SnatA (MarC family)
LTVAKAALLSYWVLAGADRVCRSLGETGIRIMMPFTGLLRVAMAAQFVLNGLGDVGLLRTR